MTFKTKKKKKKKTNQNKLCRCQWGEGSGSGGETARGDGVSEKGKGKSRGGGMKKARVGEGPVLGSRGWRGEGELDIHWREGGLFHVSAPADSCRQEFRSSFCQQ